MKRAFLIIALLSLSEINSQVNEVEPLNIQTKTTNNSYLRTQPVLDGPLNGYVKKRKTVLVVKYTAWSRMWYIQTKKGKGYIPQDYLRVTQEMIRHRNTVDSLAKRRKMAQERLAYLKIRAKNDSIDKIKKAETISRYIPPVKKKDLPKSTEVRTSNSYTGKSASTTRTYHTGPRGGCYYINSNGNKSYVDRSFCGRSSKSSYKGSSYFSGPRGGCYRYSKSGRKVYVARSKCN